MKTLKNIIKQQIYLDVDDCLGVELWTKVHLLTRPKITDMVKGKVFGEIYDRLIINEQ